MDGLAEGAGDVADESKRKRPAGCSDPAGLFYKDQLSISN
jgi:hypothetical protein